MAIGRTRRLSAALALGAVLALGLGSSVAQVASAQCADPRGNAYCTNNGQVTFPTPKPVPSPTPQAASVNLTNPNAGNVNVTNPNAPIGGTPNLSIVVAPDAASVGDTIAVGGKGFTANGRGNLIFINIVGADGVPVDTNYKPITCVETDNFYLGLLQDLGWGCASESAGPLTRSADDGTFRASITVPPVMPGADKVCISSVFSAPVCTPLAIQDGAAAPPDAASGG